MSVAEHVHRRMFIAACGGMAGPSRCFQRRHATDKIGAKENAMAEYVVEFGKDGRRVEPDGRLDAAAYHRNHQPIWTVLQKFLAGRSGDVLEAGSGTGQH